MAYNYSHMPGGGGGGGGGHWWRSRPRPTTHYTGSSTNSDLHSQASSATLGSNYGQWSTPTTARNHVSQCHLPSRLLVNTPRQDLAELRTLSYMAVQCDPKEFGETKLAQGNFQLRQQRLGRTGPDECELMIVVTMYNEKNFLFARTIAAVFTNIQYLCKKKKVREKYPNHWGGEDAWTKIVVVVVCDGKNELDFKTKCLLEAMGCYQSGIEVESKDNQAHVYENTTQVKITLDGKKVFAVPGKLEVPVQVLLCIKENNLQKINSHRWAFQAFAKVLDPRVIVLIDAGTKPDRDAIYELWKAFMINENCAGACGEIKAQIGKFGKNLFNPLVASQNFEYKISNILEKPFESVFGYISVLPGAFSAYRWSALSEDQGCVGPLYKYFKGEEMQKNNPDYDVGILKRNMYLAEDRILCFELVMKRYRKYTLQYVMSAHAETDVPKGTAEFVKQRRRWLNGTFFASVYALAHVKSIFTSGHSWGRKLAFFLEFLYQLVSLVFSWFSVANFFLIFRILVTSLDDDSLSFKPGRPLGLVFEWLYFASIFMSFVLAIGNKPERSKKIYIAMMVFWGLIMVYVLFAAIFISIKSVNREIAQDLDGKLTAGEVFANRIFRDLILSLGSTYAVHLLASILFGQPGHMIHSFIQYLLCSPSYVNILNVYAFCNIHDLSWGTKEGGDSPSCSQKPKKDTETPAAASTTNRDYNYNLAVQTLEGVNNPPEKVLTEAEKIKQKQEQIRSTYMDERCWMLLAWCSTNFALAATILNTGGLDRMVTTIHPDVVESTRSSIYLTVVLWSVTGLSGFRFLGTLWFLALRVFRGV